MSQKYKKLLKGIERWALLWSLEGVQKPHDCQLLPVFASRTSRRRQHLFLFVNSLQTICCFIFPVSLTASAALCRRVDRICLFLYPQIGFRYMESTQDACVSPAVLNIPLSSRRHFVDLPLFKRHLLVPKGQVLWHSIRHRRQAHPVRPSSWRLQVLVHVACKRNKRVRETRRHHLWNFRVFHIAC